MLYYQILNVDSGMYLACLTPKIVRLVPEEESKKDNALWYIIENTQLGGSIICCKQNKACIEIGADREIGNYEILVMRPQNQLDRTFMWKVDKVNDLVTTLDGRFSWDLHQSAYNYHMPIQLYHTFKTENQKFKFIAIG